MIKRRQQQQGYILIASLFGLAILASLIVMGARMADRHMLNTRADIEGEALSQFAVGLRGFVAQAQANPSLIPGGSQTGVSWLKSPSCGGLPGNPAEGHVPCNFEGQTFGRHYTTRLTRDPATNQIEARTSFIIPGQGNSKKRSILLADRLVLAALSQQSLPNNGMFYTAYANVPANANGPPTGAAVFNPGVDAGRVLVVASNSPSNDIWLRTDGTNQMLANLNMGGMSIANAQDGRFKGTLQVDEGLIIGDAGVVDVRGTMRATDIELTDIGAFASEGVYDAVAQVGVGTVQKPDCSQVGGNPGIYVAMQSTGGINTDGYVADALYSAGADVTDNGAFWSVTPRATGVTFDLGISGTSLSLTKNSVEHSPSDMRWVALTRCR